MTTKTKASGVVIVGKGYDYESLVPWDEGWEIWGLNDPPRCDDEASIECYTRWFQLHTPAYMRRHYPRGLDAMSQTWGRRRGVTLYMDRNYPEYPDSVPFPRDEVEAITPRGAYHASSFDWMLALAVLEGFSVIRLVEANFTTFPFLDGEPISARACLEYWAGVAEGRGATVQVLDGRHKGDLFKIIHLAKLRSTLGYGFGREPALDLAQGELNGADDWADER